jgi:hypothetical protein
MHVSKNDAEGTIGASSKDSAVAVEESPSSPSPAAPAFYSFTAHYSFTIRG